MIRFYLLIIFFLISLLSFLKAPEYNLWLLAIAVTEFPLIFFGISLLLTLTGFWAHKYQMAGTVLGLAAMLVFLSPIIRAYWVSNTLKDDMVKAFANMDGNGGPVLFTSDTPFSFGNLFKRVNGIPYKTFDYMKYRDITLKLDFYPAQLANGDIVFNRPCVIVVHGGSWAGGDSRQLPELNSYLAAKGYNVAAVNYHMAPKWQTPAPVEDIKAAIAYLKAHADELHIDIKKIVLLGRSAGAQIATLAAYTMHEPGIKGVIDFYGPEDMVWGYSVPSSRLIMDSRKVMEEYIGGTYSRVPQKYFACSPLEFVNKQSPPTLIIHGDNDVLVSPEHSRRLNLKLQQNGIKHYLLKLPWATHGFDYNLNGPGGQLSTFAVEAFLNTVCPTAP